MYVMPCGGKNTEATGATGGKTRADLTTVKTFDCWPWAVLIGPSLYFVPDAQSWFSTQIGLSQTAPPFDSLRIAGRLLRSFRLSDMTGVDRCRVK